MERMEPRVYNIFGGRSHGMVLSTIWVWFITIGLIFDGASRLFAACPGCTSIGSEVVWGVNNSAFVEETSGVAVSAKTPGVIWTHNDDSDDPFLFAIRTNGTLVARYYHFSTLNDVEDMALGPGPTNGVSYLYVGDIGGKFSVNEVRDSVRVLRIPEPVVPTNLNNQTFVFSSVQSFTLLYPDGSFEAETLMLDPVTADLFIATKQNNSSRIYRVNLNSATNNQTLVMTHVATVSFDEASGGAISSNGGRIILRNEDSARMWIRCPGESVAEALTTSPSVPIPVVGRPTEPNGEAIAFVPDGTGYITISDSFTQPPIYFFNALCSLTAPGTEITQHPQSVQVQAGSDVQLAAAAAGTNLTYQWRFGVANIPGANSPTLLLTNVQPSQAGAYSLFVSGDGGTALSSAANVSVVILPPVIVAQPPPISLAAMGSTAQLSVNVQGTPPFNFAWTRNKVPVVASGATLSLPNVQKTNNGNYRVVVSNSAGQAISGETQLKVLIAPTMYLNPLSKTNVTGSKIIVKAKAKGSPKLGYQWLFNGNPIPLAIKPKLTLLNAQPGQSGNYSVIVTNAVGSVTSAVAQVVVQ